ncbi:MAG: protein disulfide oxidoreductase [Betaproteobacteria bacterium]
MPVLNATLQKQLEEFFATLTRPVRLAVFTHAAAEPTCEICDDTRQLVEELALLSGGKLTVEAYDLADHAETARDLRIDKVPAIAVLEADGTDHGIRFFGPPSGYEFTSLIEDIHMVSSGQAELSQPTLDALGRLQTPLHIQVFVTPTCPYCPRAVVLAHRMAMASDLVRADMVDATEFPDLADRYRVHGVPRTVINDVVHIEGAVPESALMAELMPILEGQPA